MKWFKSLEQGAAELLTWRPAGRATTGERPARVEEPPFVPFDLSALRDERAATRRAAVASPASASREPATLTELGVPEELAQKLEATFRAMGATRGGQVVGFRFRTPGGAARPIRLDDAA